MANHSEMTLNENPVSQRIVQNTWNIMLLYQNVQPMLGLSYFPTHCKHFSPDTNVIFLQLTCCNLFLSRIETIPVFMGSV